MPGSDRRLRLLYLNYEYPPIGGGGGVVTRDLAEAIADRADVTVITTKRQDLVAEEVINGVRIIRVPVLMRRDRAIATLPSMLSFVPASVMRGRKLIRQESFDLLHTFFAVPTGPSGVSLARKGGLPHVLTILGGDIYDPTKFLSPHRFAPLGWTVRSVLAKSDCVVAESNDVKARAESLYGRAGIRMIRHGFRVPEFTALPREELDLGLRDSDFVMVAVGRLVRRKRMDALIRVLAKLRDDVKLLIVGDGPLRGELEAQAKALGVADRVRFAGFVSDERKFQALAASDLFTYTTEHEGFGIVYLEAMYCGLPVVTYDCGGQGDFLTDEVGTLVPAGDEAGFLAAVQELVENDERRSGMARAARAKAEQMEMGSVAEDYISLYREVIESKRAEQAG